MSSKTNFKEILVISAYFSKPRLFLPIFFALLQSVNNLETYLRALHKFKSCFLQKQHSLHPDSELVCPFKA